MIAGLKELLFGSPAAARAAKPGADELQLAAAALLIEAALLDGRFEAAERKAILDTLERHFDLSDDEAAALVAKATEMEAESVQLYGFTHVIKDRLAPEERVGIIEMLWEVAYADGRVDAYESGLVRRVAGLLFVSDVESGAARKRVRTRLDTESHSHK